jgi:hypothetical protein
LNGFPCTTRLVWHRPTVRALSVASLTAAACGFGPLAASAAAHGAGADEQKLGERRLRTLESRLLGTEHAAEHAAMRAAMRRPVDPRVERRLRQRALAAAGPANEVGAWVGGARRITRNRNPDESLPAINSIMLPTGKVLMFGPPLSPSTPRNPRVNEAAAVLFDPATETFEDVPPPVDPRTGRRANIFCAGASLMSDGRVLITGGFLDFDETRPNYVNSRGLNHVWTFDPWTKGWTRHENLGGGTDRFSIRGGRWYPSQTLMPDGRTLIVGGLTEEGNRSNTSIEIFDPRKPAGDELDTLRITTPMTSILSGSYPHMFWTPGGRVLVLGATRENSWDVQPRGSLDFALTDVAEPSRDRVYGTAVLLPLNVDSPSARVMLTGGYVYPDPAVTSSETYDESSGRWDGAAALNVPRAHHNTVLLPDGSMVAIGGGAGSANLYAFDPQHAERQVELYRDGRWITGPPQAEGRSYHSTALLLPDASVVSAGDDKPNPDDANPQLDTYEIYEPPYFYTGNRPEIRTAPASAGYDSVISVGTTSTDIDRAVLIAPGAATHAVDMNQRLVNLPVSQKADKTGYDVRMPKNPNVAVAGHYMLFIVDRQGRPSLASWIGLGVDSRPGGGTQGTPVTPPEPPAPPAPAEEPAPPAPVAVAPPPVAPARPAARPRRRGPRITARLSSVRLRVVRRRGRLVLRVGMGERGRVSLAARLFRIRARSKKRRVSLGFWQRQLRFRRANTRTVAFRLTRPQRRRMRGDVRFRVVIRARGARSGRGARIVWFRLRRPGAAGRPASAGAEVRLAGRDVVLR